MPTMNAAVLEDIIRYNILFNTRTQTVRTAVTITTTTIFPYVLIKTVQTRYLYGITVAAAVLMAIITIMYGNDKPEVGKRKSDGQLYTIIIIIIIIIRTATGTFPN